MSKSVNLALFASGNGSNAEAIIRYFEGHPRIRVSDIFCNNPGAYVIERARHHRIDCLVFGRKDFATGGPVQERLCRSEVRYIALAGFLWLIPGFLVEAYAGRILNIHPALLPKYGGKGMYGQKVHEAVIAAGEAVSGISIHTVDEVYDRGQLVFQAECPVYGSDTPETLAKRIHELEHRHYPAVLESFILHNEPAEKTP